jgi:signal transduction histidine kinase
MSSEGLPVDLSIEGVPGAELPAGVDLTAYRVVQEALAEALRAGGAGRADVHVRYTDDGVEVEIVDDGHRINGRRLLGMQERVRVYGGQLEIDPRRDGCHCVIARLPREAAA